MLAMTGATAAFGSQLLLGSLYPAAGLAMIGGAGHYLYKRLYADGYDKKARPQDVDSCVFHGHEHHDHKHEHNHDHEHEHEHDEAHPHDMPVPARKTPSSLHVAWAVAAMGGLALSANTLVKSALDIAHTTVTGEAMAGVLAVAIGTSLPELSISIKAALKKQGGFALGNVMGCTTFNTLAVGGAVALSGMAVPHALSASSSLGMLTTGAYMGSAALVAALLWKNRGAMKKIHGYALLGLYAAFVASATMMNDGHAPTLHDHGTRPVSAPATVESSRLHVPGIAPLYLSLG